MSKRRRYLSESESESEPAAEEANGGESEEADEPYSTIWRAAGPLTMRQDMQHDSQVLYSLRTGDLVKQTKPAVTVRTTGRKYVHVSTVVAATGQEVLGWVTSLLGTEFPSAPAGLQEILEAEQEEAVGRYQAALSTPVSTTVAPASAPRSRRVRQHGGWPLLLPPHAPLSSCDGPCVPSNSSRQQ